MAGHSHSFSFPRCTLMMRLIISAFSYSLVFRVVCSCFNCSQVCPEVALWTSGYLIRENGATQWALIREQQTVCIWVCVWFALKSVSSTLHSKYILYMFSGRWRRRNLDSFYILVVVQSSYVSYVARPIENKCLVVRFKWINRLNKLLVFLFCILIDIVALKRDTHGDLQKSY